MLKEHKQDIIEIALGAVLFIAAILVKHNVVSLILFLSAYAVCGHDAVAAAVRNILKGRVFDENFLMTIASGGAFIIGEYPEGVAVMLFYRVGELFEQCAVERSRRSVTDLMDIAPDTANIIDDGIITSVCADDVNVGDIILVRVGERIPLDGVVCEGNSFLDTSALTGESVPRKISVGDTVLSGSINMNGIIHVRVTKIACESTAARILELIEEASERKARCENFITKFARYYTPAVVGFAAVIAVIPPLIFGDFVGWIYKALMFLVVSCPCALVLSVPMTFFCSIGGASKHGVLIKGSSYIEMLSKTGTIVTDKTGTLTKGTFEVTQIIGESKEDLLYLAAHAEIGSTHPIAESIKQAYGKELSADKVSDYLETAGRGVSATVDGRKVLAGGRTYLLESGIECPNVEGVLVAENGKYVGSILVSDTIKPESFNAINEAKKYGVRTVMLTGDSKTNAMNVAKELGIDEVYAELLPQDKTAHLERIIADSEKACAYIGDGINDAPVLARADVGIAMGAGGSDAAIEAADVVLMNDDISKAVRSVTASRRTMRIVWQNIIGALSVKIAVLVLCTIGVTGMWTAVFADVGVAVLAILNAVRTLKFS